MRHIKMSYISVFLGLALWGGVHPALAHQQSTLLALGDGKVSTSPTKGYVYVCNSRFGSNQRGNQVIPWIKDGYWNPSIKPVVEGNVLWPNSAITLTVEGNERVIRANNLPIHPTGEFPIRSGTEAYQYDRNPNSIGEQSILLRLPSGPEMADNASCVSMGMIGFTLSGAAIFNAFDGGGRDAAAYEIQDKCNGHPQMQGQYHYHNWSPCIADQGGQKGGHSDLAGFIIDGFPIFGLKGERGVELTNADLDGCHGHTHEIPLDGKKVVMYHYHFTREYPYSVGCFRGKPIRTSGKGAQQRPDGMQRPNQGGHQGAMPPKNHQAILQAVAEDLRIDQRQLRAALGPPPPDFDVVSQKLGIPASELQRAFQAARQRLGDGR